MATRKGVPFFDQSAICLHAVCRTHSDSAKINPVASATGMNRAGKTSDALVGSHGAGTGFFLTQGLRFCEMR
jgi:hypothetical protein